MHELKLSALISAASNTGKLTFLPFTETWKTLRGAGYKHNNDKWANAAIAFRQLAYNFSPQRGAAADAAQQPQHQGQGHKVRSQHLAEPASG